MFKSIIEAIRSLFSSLFGGGSKSKPRPVKDDRPLEERAQDGSEIRPDTIVIVANEMDTVVVPPGTADQDFDEDLFDDPGGETPPPPVAPPPPKPTPITPPPPEIPTPEPKPEPEPNSGRYLWCLDNGHGKQTAGKRSPRFADGSRFMEYEFNRDIVSRMIPQLEAAGVSFFNVVPEVDIDNFLKGRVQRANSKASDLPKMFVSIHANAAPARSAEDWASDSISGIETWFYHSSKTGQKVAAVFQKHLIEQTGWVNRHLKSRPKRQFYVLAKTRMPSILTENGFYNNKREATELMKPEVRQKIADAHVKAILEIERNGI